MKTIKDFDDLIPLSLGLGKKGITDGEIDCEFEVIEDNETFKVYTASVAYRDILLYSDKGCLSYVVDSYGNRNSVECVNIERD